MEPQSGIRNPKCEDEGMTGPYRDLHVYEVEGILSEFPRAWKALGFLGCWQEAGYSFLFFALPQKEEVDRFVEGRPGARVRTTTVLPYEDWEAGGPLKPFRVGSLWVCPPWEMANPGQGERLIVVDPGVSFGSGHHASTRACLELMVDLYQEASPLRVLDLGTGSGILALAAAGLGAEKVLAVDAQPLAVETARANVARNGLEHFIEVRLCDVREVLSEPADLVIANLTYSVLIDLLQSEALYGRPWYIFSGLVGGQAHELEKRLPPDRLRVQAVRSQNFWFSLLLSENRADL